MSPKPDHGFDRFRVQEQSLRCSSSAPAAACRVMGGSSEPGCSVPRLGRKCGLWAPVAWGRSRTSTRQIVGSECQSWASIKPRPHILPIQGGLGFGDQA